MERRCCLRCTCNTLEELQLTWMVPIEVCTSGLSPVGLARYHLMSGVEQLYARKLLP